MKQTQKNSQENIIIGRLGAVYGVRGWFHLHSFTDPIDNILEYSEWMICHNKKWQLFHPEQGKVHGKGLIVKLQEINDREIAREYTNDHIAIPRQSLPALVEGEHYWADLIGSSVHTTNHQPLGTIQEIMPTGSNDVLVVVGDKKRLIPYTDDVIVSVDHHQKIVTVDWDPDF